FAFYERKYRDLGERRVCRSTGCLQLKNPLPHLQALQRKAERARLTSVSGICNTPQFAEAETVVCIRRRSKALTLLAPLHEERSAGRGRRSAHRLRTSLLALASSSDVDNGMLIALQTVAGLKPLREI